MQERNIAREILLAKIKEKQCIRIIEIGPLRLDNIIALLKKLNHLRNASIENHKDYQ